VATASTAKKEEDSGGGGYAAKMRRAWADPRQRRMINMWVGFCLAITITLIVVTVVVVRFTTGFHRSEAEDLQNGASREEYVGEASVLGSSRRNTNHF
jgi:hypothetical protein